MRFAYRIYALYADWRRWSRSGCHERDSVISILMSMTTTTTTTFPVSGRWNWNLSRSSLSLVLHLCLSDIFFLVSSCRPPNKMSHDQRWIYNIWMQSALFPMKNIRNRKVHKKEQTEKRFDFALKYAKDRNQCATASSSSPSYEENNDADIRAKEQRRHECDYNQFVNSNIS